MGFGTGIRSADPLSHTTGARSISNTGTSTTSQEAQLPWLVIYTKPRQEKKLAERPPAKPAIPFTAPPNA